jgi:hypothetical protein
MSLVANFRKSHLLPIRPLVGAWPGTFSLHSSKAWAPNQPDGTRMAILEIDLPALFPLFDTARRHRL